MKKVSDATSYLLIKMITTHFQTVSFVSNIKLEMPQILKNVNSFQAPITSTESFVFTIECFKKSFEPLKMFAVKILLSLGISLSIVSGLGIFWGVWVYKRRAGKKLFIEKYVNSLVVVASFFQPQFINFYIQNMNCETINNESFLTFDLSQECWDSTHSLFVWVFAFPLLLIWMVIYPGIFLYTMYKNKHQLDDDYILQITKYFQVGYRKERFYWEFVQMLRKFLIILLTTFLRNHHKAAIFVLIPFVSLFLAIQIIMKPYTETRFNNLELISLNACFITYYCAVFYISGENTEAGKIFLLLIILASNISFIVFWLRQYVMVVRRKIKKVVSNVANFLSNKSITKKGGSMKAKIQPESITNDKK